MPFRLPLVYRAGPVSPPQAHLSAPVNRAGGAGEEKGLSDVFMRSRVSIDQSDCHAKNAPWLWQSDWSIQTRDLMNTNNIC